MEIKIIDITQDTKGFRQDSPLTYRLRLFIDKDILILKREYFYYGFSDMEKFDGYWISHSSDGRVHWVNFLTRKLKNPEYLQISENKLFEIFYEESLKTSIKMKKDLNSQIKRITNSIIKENEVSEYLSTFNRNRKIQKIVDLIK